MKRRLILVVLTLLLILAACPDQAAVINVPSPGITTIQDGINAASTGDTVLVAPGTYYEAIVITTSLTLESSGGPAVTIINGNSATDNYYMVNIGADNVIVDGFTITNPVYGDTADASGVVIGSLSTNTNIRVTNCIIHDIGNQTRTGVSFGTFGVNCGPVDQLEIDHNVIYNIQDGGNDFADVGMFIYGNDVTSPATNINIHDNVVYNVGSPSAFDTSIYVGENSSGIMVQANTVYPTTSTALQTGEYGISSRPDGLGPTSLIGNFTHLAGLAGIRLRNPFGDTVYGNDVYQNPTGILVNNTSAGSTVTYNNIWGNTTYGLDNQAALLPATNDWWGAASGPSGIGPGTGDAIAGLVTFAPFLTAPTGQMSLGPVVPITYVGPGQTVTLTLSQSGLATPRTGFQAYLTFDPAALSFTSATYTSTPYGISTPPIVGTGEVILSALATIIQGPTTSDAPLADVVFTADSVDGPTKITFGTSPDSPLITPPTRLFDVSSLAVLPVTTDSSTIYVDATPPSIDIISAKQNSVELIGGPPANIGPVDIAVTASDSGSGLAGNPTVTVTPNGGGAETATFVNESPTGTFNYVWNVTSLTPSGPAVINASVSDNVGNIGNAVPKTITVAEAQLSVTVELQGIVTTPVTRTIKLVLGGGGPTLTINQAITFTNRIGTTSISIPNPFAYTCISAKDVQHTLYSTVSISNTGLGQYAANLTGAKKLRGGDIDNNNVVDVYDYGVIAVQWNTTGHPYPYPTLDADINDDGKVYKEDFQIFWNNFLTGGDEPCGGSFPPPPAYRITVAQLAPLVGGLTNARKADLNRDGYIDSADVRLFLYRYVLPVR